MRVLVLSALVLALSANGANAARWSLGANLGATYLSFDDSENDYLLVGLPSQSFEFLFPPPGLRLGIAPRESRVEYFLDVGLLNTDFNSSTTFQLGGNVQYNFSTASTHPYVAAGVGMSLVDGSSLFGAVHSVAPTFGAGLGMRHRLSHGFGTLRAEFRYDRQVADPESFVLIDGNSLALKLGFDVWFN